VIQVLSGSASRYSLSDNRVSQAARELMGGQRVKIIKRRYLPVNPASHESYLALSTGTAVTAAESVSISDVAFGTGKVNT
jgi:hypothetical protein